MYQTIIHHQNKKIVKMGGCLDAFLVLTLSDEEDVWKWELGEEGTFSVKSTYSFLGSIFSPESDFGVQELRVLNNIWKSPAPLR
jgi:hypothetical protein